ncbi:symmetrical bis(5'-nucleosyl)-tetraphosphatase [Aliidiomarina indica]|uniref:symmetrical bis(5'-nucleosyl)-tetraphosphatase n=1 Tax=Aliidiomarina indica TaxID=2749147 RepID=UPI00188EA8E0|nr:symmetrical bis(5'-nucleosyl)-tetraphosphatase [Aliidiomarina indica]
MARYIIGDIHACLAPLKRLLAAVDFNPRHDQLWSVGDLIGRGPEPLATLEYLVELGPAFQCVLGNHDLHALAVLCDVRPANRNDNTHALREGSDRDFWIQWLRRHPLLITDPERLQLIVHAGLHPAWTVEMAQSCARDVETTLRSSNFVSFLERMYGNEPSQWSDSLYGVERARFIVNAMTRMRYLHADGQLDFDQKEHPSHCSQPDVIPWFELWPQSPWTIFFGHWAALQGETHRADIRALDTGCVWGEQLTLINAETLELTQVSAD